MSLPFPLPVGGASMLLSFRLHAKAVLILGSGSLSASRAFAALEADSEVVILSKGGASLACEEIKWRAEQGQLTIIDWNSIAGSSTSDTDIEALEYFLRTQPKQFTLACVTDTIIGEERRSRESAAKIYSLFKNWNIPVNTTDMPEFCDFSFTSSHRFTSQDGPSSLQVGVTSNGQGCRLAGRIRREIVAKLPKDVGLAVAKVGKMRSLAKLDDGEDSYDDSSVSTPNLPVPPRSPTETALESARRRMKWVAQVSEYWPIAKLAGSTEEEMAAVLAGEGDMVACKTPSLHDLNVPAQGRIFLVGSGPGHPSLLTIATHTALTKKAHLVLSDKLVPDAVLALIPKNVEVRIARKFPGNADGAQNEMMEAAVDAAKKGMTVVRLKQGDPVVYGRAGEEVLYFRSHGFEPIVVPGVSSALAAPTFAGIPVTQRGVAESFIVCTGVGRKGKDVQLPAYERARTLVLLMGVARLPQIVEAMLETKGTRRTGEAYPPHTPVAIIERASMPDQRVLTSTLRDVVLALENAGEQRPPGLMVVGWGVLALFGKGNTEVLVLGAEKDDEERVLSWLGPNLRWRVSEGLDPGWELLNA